MMMFITIGLSDRLARPRALRLGTDQALKHADAEPPLLVTTMVTSTVELLCFLLFFSFRRTSACRTHRATALFVLC